MFNTNNMTNENPKIEIIDKRPFTYDLKTITCVDGKMHWGPGLMIVKKDGTLFSYNGQTRFEYIYVHNDGTTIPTIDGIEWITVPKGSVIIP
jgi:hypothetical protein